MSLYADLTDEQLDAEIASLRTKMRDPEPGVRSVAGEGRRMEFFGGNSSNLQSLLRQALEEKARREGRPAGGAIGVWFR